MNKKCINPKELFNSTQYGFSQIVVSGPGRMVFISGQVAWDEKMDIVGKGNLKLQTQQSIDNIKIAIESAGGNLENIVMLRIYKVNYKKRRWPCNKSDSEEKFWCSFAACKYMDKCTGPCK